MKTHGITSMERGIIEEVVRRAGFSAVLSELAELATRKQVKALSAGRCEDANDFGYISETLLAVDLG